MGTPAFDKAHTKFVGLKFNIKTDADILERLKEHGNIQGYIKSLIRADIAAHAGQKKEDEAQ